MYDKVGLIAHLQVLRYDSFKFLKCYSSPMKAATGVHASLFKPTHYLQSVQETSNKVSHHFR